VTFTETGLPAGTSWGVYVGTQPEVTGTGTSLTVTGVENNTWAYAVVAPSGWTASPSGGSVTVAGVNKTIGVTFTAVSTSTGTSNNPNYLGTLAWTLIAVLAVLAIIFLVLALVFRGRRPPTSSPPQTWSASGEGGSSSSGGESSGGGSSPPESSS
jgi:hypothetical protein